MKGRSILSRLSSNRLGWVVVFGLLAPACDDAPPATPSAPPSKAAAGLNVLTKGSEAAATADSAAVPAGDPPPASSPTGEAASAEGEIAYAYSPIGKRDPFRSPLEEFNREDQGQQLTELQRFEIDQLKLVAIVSRVATPYAMVEDPNAKGHTLTRGTLIGKNWGKVSQITGECVEIKEDYRDYTGRKQSNKLQLCLPKPPELKLD
ncbi:MAG: pilus assembly protein PilP [Deltaproteobacteria bacterium]|nr:pilus assembly protein PilP [Deltaproteobacteria bacterium]